MSTPVHQLYIRLEDAELGLELMLQERNDLAMKIKATDEADLKQRLHEADDALEQLLEERNDLAEAIRVAEERKIVHARGYMLAAMTRSILYNIKEDHVQALYMANKLWLPFREELPAKYFKHTLEAMPEGPLPSGWSHAATEAFFVAAQLAIERDMAGLVV